MRKRSAVSRMPKLGENEPEGAKLIHDLSITNKKHPVIKARHNACYRCCCSRYCGLVSAGLLVTILGGGLWLYLYTPQMMDSRRYFTIEDKRKQFSFNETKRSDPTFIDGRFGNPWPTFQERWFWDLLAWKKGWKPEAEKAYDKKLSKLLAETTIDSKYASNNYKTLKDYEIPIDYSKINAPLSPGQVRVTWLGHATTLVQMPNGYTILFDPIMSDSVFALMNHKRRTQLPTSIKGLKENGVRLDAVGISHGHFDHLEPSTLESVHKHYPECIFYFPTGQDQLVSSKVPTQALTWWESTTVPKSTTKITMVPAQHWTSRTLLDKNKCLWGGFVIEADGVKAYYTGDTGYAQVFEEIAHNFPDITLALIPVGAYTPRWFMSPQHISPEEAVQVFKDVGCKHAIGIHWLTFNLASDPGLTPVPELRYFKQKQDVVNFNLLAVGETATYE